MSASTKAYMRRDAEFIIDYLNVSTLSHLSFLYEYVTVVSRYPPKLRYYESGIEQLIHFHAFNE